MVHKGPLVDVILGVEYQHYDVDSHNAFCLPGCARHLDRLRPELEGRPRARSAHHQDPGVRLVLLTLGPALPRFYAEMQSSAGPPPAEGFLFVCLRQSKKGWNALYAYLAGVIDTHGRISISRDRGYRRGGREMAYYSAVITLSDSDSVLPDLSQATFPGAPSAI